LGNAVLDVLLEEGLLEKGRQAAEHLWNRLRALKQKHPDVIRDIHGKGMMIGIHTKRSPEEIRRLMLDFLKEGTLVNVTARTVIRLLPPLTLTREEIDRFADALDEYISARFSALVAPEKFPVNSKLSYPAVRKEAGHDD